MPWSEASTMSLRRDFVKLASQEGANVRQLCRRFEVSAKTARKWLACVCADGPAGLAFATVGRTIRRPRARTSVSIAPGQPLLTQPARLSPFAARVGVRRGGRGA